MKQKNRQSTKLAASLMIIALLIGYSTQMEFKGINFASLPLIETKYSSNYSKKSLEHLRSTGANWVSIPVTYWVDTVRASEMKPVYARLRTLDRVIETPSDKDLVSVISHAKKLGLKVMLLPRIDLNARGYHDLTNLGEIYSPYQARRFFRYWIKNLVKLGILAEKTGVEMLCVGHHLPYLAAYQKHWEEVIKDVKKVYNGKLTYSASHRQEFKKAGFWKSLDYIGLIADFEIQIGDEATAEQKRRQQIEELKRRASYLHRVWKKEVIITRAVSHAAVKIDDYYKVLEVFHHTQNEIYRDLLEAIQGVGYIRGVFWGDWLADTRFGGKKDAGPTPQFKEAELVLREYYGGEKAVPEKTEEFEVYSSRSRQYCGYCNKLDHPIVNNNYEPTHGLGY